MPLNSMFTGMMGSPQPPPPQPNQGMYNSFGQTQQQVGTRAGLGGSQVPQAMSPQMRLSGMADMYANAGNGSWNGRGDPGMGGMVYGNNIHRQITQQNPSIMRTPELNQKMGPMGNMGGGVEPGHMPAMNSVQAARAGIGGSNPMAGGDYGPKQAALAGYR